MLHLIYSSYCIIHVHSLYMPKPRKVSSHHLFYVKCYPNSLSKKNIKKNKKLFCWLYWTPHKSLTRQHRLKVLILCMLSKLKKWQRPKKINKYLKTKMKPKYYEDSERQNNDLKKSEKCRRIRKPLRLENNNMQCKKGVS